MDGAEPAGGGAQRCARVVLLDVHVVRVGEHADGVRPRRRRELGGLGDGVDHVVLVAVERLEQQEHAGRRGVATELCQPFEEHLAVLLRGPRRLVERGQPAREHAPRGRGDHATAAECRDAVELAP
jgi:hypothetical protein